MLDFLFGMFFWHELTDPMGVKKQLMKDAVKEAIDEWLVDHGQNYETLDPENDDPDDGEEATPTQSTPQTETSNVIDFTKFRRVS